MPLKPLPGYLLIKQLDAQKQTAGGIFIPENNLEAPIEGEVVRVGDPIILENGTEVSSPVKIGDLVIWKRWGGDEIKDGDAEYKIVKFEDLMAVKEADGKN